VAVLVAMPGAVGRQTADPERQLVNPLGGSPEQIVHGLRAYAAEGIAEVQLVVDPITQDSIEGLSPVLALLDSP
jgi:alkanesulfonate monooxygenase SsuD/methylene tetrahydromethanopterin reductase-like flavin-dependent oxidoreductase (luciferase family)